jgi:hypothetical protein
LTGAGLPASDFKKSVICQPLPSATNSAEHGWREHAPGAEFHPEALPGRKGYCIGTDGRSPSPALGALRGARGLKGASVKGEHQLFGFLTTEANATVARIHLKGMLVILTTPDEFDRWLEADTLEGSSCNGHC